MKSCPERYMNTCWKSSTRFIRKKKRKRRRRRSRKLLLEREKRRQRRKTKSEQGNVRKTMPQAAAGRATKHDLKLLRCVCC